MKLRRINVKQRNGATRTINNCPELTCAPKLALKSIHPSFVYVIEISNSPASFLERLLLG